MYLLASYLTVNSSNIAMLNQITPETALYYNFHTTDSSPPPSTISAPQTKLGPDEALKELLRRGCSLATQEWVNNHWCLILWKLAGMVALDPEKEANPDEARWCWSEVIRQLLYR
jgi:breast cancer 2 susceptibility protein